MTTCYPGDNGKCWVCGFGELSSLCHVSEKVATDIMSQGIMTPTIDQVQDSVNRLALTESLNDHWNGIDRVLSRVIGITRTSGQPTLF